MFKELPTFYDYRFYFAIVRKNKDFKKLAKKLDSLNIDFDLENFKSCLGCTLEVGYGESLILINTKRKNDLVTNLATIRHEVHHASSALYRFIGEKIERLDSEAFLYLNDYLFEEITKDLLDNATT